MGWGWRLAVAAGVATMVLIGLLADIARPPAEPFSTTPPSSPFRSALGILILTAINVGLELIEARGATDGPDGDGTQYFFADTLAAVPLPSWVVMAATAILLVALASRTLHRRPLPVPESEIAEARSAPPLLFAAPSRGPLFRQTVIYVNIGPRWSPGPPAASRAHAGPRGGPALSRGFLGLLEAPGSARHGWTLPYGEPSA